MVGCGGDVDTGGPSATGGQPQVFYGMGLVAGGTTGIDAGTPAATGGQFSIIEYGPVSVLTGGSTGVAGGNTSNDSGTPTTTGGHVTVVYGVN